MQIYTYVYINNVYLYLLLFCKFVTFCRVQHRKHANKEIDMRGRPVKNRNNSDTQCDICGQSFDTIPATIRHRFKVHSNSPAKFYCSYCGKQFPLKVGVSQCFILLLL